MVKALPSATRVRMVTTHPGRAEAGPQNVSAARVVKTENTFISSRGGSGLLESL